MMVRAKKNKIRSHEKQLKTKIKHLKNQLGKVRSGKEAKKLKNKKVVKKKH
jgi:outer membrane murein-binding lipoprotein Lpp